MAESLKKKTVKGVAWTSLNQFLNMGLGFVIGVILARLLSPSDYGLLAMIGVFNAIAFAFLDSGFGSALVRKPNLTEDGLGVWALVAMHIADSVISLVLLWIISPWRPRGRWSKTSFRYLWGYGSKLLASGLLDTIYGNIYPIVIGKFYSAADLGQYTRAKQYAGMPAGTLTGVIQQVTFPVLSQIQEDDTRLANNYRRMLRFTVFIVFPVMMGMAALAYPLVISLVTDKWAQCVPYLQVICFASMWYPVHAINLNLLQVKGRSDLFLRLEIIKKALITVVIFVCVPFGIMGICCGAIFTSLACLAINTHYTGKLINVGFLRQMMDMTPTLLASLAMGAVVYFTVMLFDNNWVKLAIGIPLGAALYLAIAKIFRMPELQEALDIIHRR